MQINESGNVLVITDATDQERKNIILSVETLAHSDTDRRLSRKEVAKMLGVHIETIKRYGRAGTLTPLRLSPRCVRYSEREVLELIESSKGAAA